MRHLPFILLRALALVPAQATPPDAGGHTGAGLMGLPLGNFQARVSGNCEGQEPLVAAPGAPPIICVDRMINRRQPPRPVRDAMSPLPEHELRRPALVLAFRARLDKTPYPRLRRRNGQCTA